MTAVLIYAFIGGVAAFFFCQLLKVLAARLIERQRESLRDKNEELCLISGTRV